ncbi:hypothetical protein [Pseudomonas aeruginosa]|uniref:hypothetical protein n=1 Tax=Pseudomonas aeruginosa TaxID=287 RepID=UPI00053ECB44|nr:hypothetical protein [Pseudomonas aeruginosa]HEO1562735.1 hypothetical protein [Pseudomonas aeruginosa]
MTDTNKQKLAQPKEDFDTQWKLDDAKEKIVEAMCMTWRHDFGLSKRHGPFGYSGMTPDEQDSLRSRMGQLFDHHIAHFVRDEEDRSRSLFTLESGILSLQSDLIDELRAEAEQLRKDAARYRWLRDSCTRQWDVMYQDIEIVIDGTGVDECEDLDGIIDAAIEGAKQ